MSYIRIRFKRDRDIDREREGGREDLIVFRVGFIFGF